MRKTLKALTGHKTLFALVLALTIFGAVYGFAATLNVNSNTLSAGNASVASCQTTGSPTGTYAIAYDQTLATYKVTSVTVTGLHANCAGKAVTVTLTDGSNNSLGSVSGTVPAGGGTLGPVAVTGSVSAAAVQNVSVAING
jgi:hypothetical protein